MTGCIGAGLDEDKFDLIQCELKMVLEAEQDEDDDAEMLDSDDNGMVTSSTIREWCQEVGAHVPRVL